MAVSVKCLPSGVKKRSSNPTTGEAGGRDSKIAGADWPTKTVGDPDSERKGGRKGERG